MKIKLFKKKQAMNVAPYMCGESTEVWIPIPHEVKTAAAEQRVKSHAYRLRRHANVQIFYACDKDGGGIRLIRCILDKPIEKLPRGRKAKNEKKD